MTKAKGFLSLSSGLIFSAILSTLSAILTLTLNKVKGKGKDLRFFVVSLLRITRLLRKRSFHGPAADAEKPGYVLDAFAAMPELRHAPIPGRQPQPLLPPRFLLQASRQGAIQTGAEDLAALIPPVDLLRQ
jgi:hypothetical protein